MSCLTSCPGPVCLAMTGCFTPQTPSRRLERVFWCFGGLLATEEGWFLVGWGTRKLVAGWEILPDFDTYCMDPGGGFSNAFNLLSFILAAKIGLSMYLHHDSLLGTVSWPASSASEQSYLPLRLCLLLLYFPPTPRHHFLPPRIFLACQLFHTLSKATLKPPVVPYKFCRSYP